MEFGKGFSPINLKLMRQFYMEYCDRIGQMPSDQLALQSKKQSAPKVLLPTAIGCSSQKVDPIQ